MNKRIALSLVGLLAVAGCAYTAEEDTGWDRARSEDLFEVPDSAVITDDGQTVIVPSARPSLGGSYSPPVVIERENTYAPPVVIERSAPRRVYRPSILRPYPYAGVVVRDYDDSSRVRRAYRDGRRDALRGLERDRREAVRPRVERRDDRRGRGSSGPCVFGLANDDCN